MDKILPKQFWHYGWGRRMAKLAPKGQHEVWSLVLLGLSIEAEEPSGLVPIDTAALAAHLRISPETVDMILQRLRQLGALEPHGDLDRVDPTHIEGCSLSPKWERYFEQQRHEFERRLSDE